MEKVALGADHAGFEAKQKIIEHLTGDYEIIDFGVNSLEPGDYPFYARRVARFVRERGGLGILVCGSGIGMSIAANRHREVYAARCVSAEEAQTARRTGANVLCIGGKNYVPARILSIVDAFLKTGFSGEERHKMRLAQIDELAYGQ